MSPAPRLLVFAAALAAVLVAPVRAMDLANSALLGDPGGNGRNPSSVLIYPIHRSGAGFFTVVSVTNLNESPTAGTTRIHYQYANVVPNPANPFRPLACSIFNTLEVLTPGDTQAVLTNCHNAAGIIGQEGYLVVSACDPNAPVIQPWTFNHLVGSEIVINASGIMYILNAVGIGAVTTAGPTDVNGNGVLDFDGVEYGGLGDKLYIDSFIALANSSLTLISLTGGPNDLHTIQFSIYNDDEFPLSVTRNFNCWFDQRLTVIAPNFTEAFLLGLPDAPDEFDTDCDGDGEIETGWAVIESLGVQIPGGSLLAADGALVGSITAGTTAQIDGGHLLWESKDKQFNGGFANP